jgi:hypothetical protein
MGEVMLCLSPNYQYCSYLLPLAQSKVHLAGAFEKCQLTRVKLYSIVLLTVYKGRREGRKESMLCKDT